VSDDDKLAIPDATRLPDAYEEKYMPGEGMVVYRDKSKAPWPLHAIFAALTVASSAAAIATAAWGAAAITIAMCGLMWLLFAVLRVTVSEKIVNVQYGLFGPRIPMEAIESAEAVDYDWKQFGGWGIRVNAKGEWMYNMPGDGGHAVKIVWAKKGKRKVTYVGSLHHERLAAQIQRARAALPAGAQTKALGE
jgi:hypothetical protein